MMMMMRSGAQQPHRSDAESNSSLSTYRSENRHVTAPRSDPAVTMIVGGQCAKTSRLTFIAARRRRHYGAAHTPRSRRCGNKLRDGAKLSIASITTSVPRRHTGSVAATGALPDATDADEPINPWQSRRRPTTRLTKYRAAKRESNLCLC